jgi:hypothetical protein
VDWRWYEGGKLDNTRREGGVGPDTSSINDLGSVSYTSLNLTYDLNLPGLEKFQLFGRVDNVFDEPPVFPLNASFNDNGGRGYRAGVRITL